jgi:hypothetical protein
MKLKKYNVNLKMNNNLLKINKNDINLVNERFINKQYFQENEINNLKNDFIKYKSEIKEVINKLYKSYYDISNNIECNENEEKYIFYFNMFIKKIILNIKLDKKNDYIQNELLDYSNNSLNKCENIILDNSNNYINDLDKRVFLFKSTKGNKMDEYLNISKKTNKILPKKYNN